MSPSPLHKSAVQNVRTGSNQDLAILDNRGQSRGVRFIRDFVVCPVPFPSAAEYLQRDFRSWIAPLVTSAIDDGERLRIRVGPGTGPRIVAKQVEVDLGDLRKHRDEVVVALSWQVNGGSWLFPRLDADIGLGSLDEERSHLWLDGSYIPPLGRPGQMLDRTLMYRVAEITIRSFLVAVSRAIEQRSGDNV